jgi:hypothetical protein
VFVYRRSVAVSNATLQYQSAASAEPQGLGGLAGSDLGPGVEERLKQIADEHDRDKP